MPLLALLKVRKSAVLLVNVLALDSHAPLPDFTIVCEHGVAVAPPPPFPVT